MLKILKLSLLLVSGNCLVANTRYARPVSTKAYKKNSKDTTISKIKPVNILTLDLETRKLSDNNLEVISSCIFDGTNYYTFYLTDYLTPEALLEATVETLLKFNGYKVYIHNSSAFDAIFLFKHILDLKAKGYEVNILKREDKFIKIAITKTEIKTKTKNITSPTLKEGVIITSKLTTVFNLTIYDSLLLLPHSLGKLSKAFNVSGKLDFNVLENDAADLSDLKFRERLLAYNQEDCKILYDVILSFNNIFKDLFKLTILDSPTLG